MVKYLSLLIIFISSIGFGQEPTASIEQTEMNVLYRGYQNKLSVDASNNNGAEVELTCSDCDTVYRTNDNNYVVEPGEGRTLFLYVNLISGNSVETIKRSQYRVRPLPNPTLFWGASKSGNKASPHSRLLLAKYTSEIQIYARFVVIRWSVEINGIEYKGEGNSLKSIDDAIKEIEHRSKVKFKAVVKGPNNMERTITGVFSL